MPSLELVEGAALRCPVDAPAHEPRRMPQAITVEPVVFHFGDPVQAERNPIHPHVGRPPPRSPLEAAERTAFDQEPVRPRVLLQRNSGRAELLEEAPTLCVAEGARNADVAELAVPVEEAEQQGSDLVPLAHPPVAGDDG